MPDSDDNIPDSVAPEFDSVKFINTNTPTHKPHLLHKIWLLHLSLDKKNKRERNSMSITLALAVIYILVKAYGVNVLRR